MPNPEGYQDLNTITEQVEAPIAPVSAVSEAETLAAVETAEGNILDMLAEARVQ